MNFPSKSGSTETRPGSGVAVSFHFIARPERPGSYTAGSSPGEAAILGLVALYGVEQMIQQSRYNPRTIKYVRNSSKSIPESLIKERSRPFLSSG